MIVFSVNSVSSLTIPVSVKEADVTELIYQFMAVDALVAAGLKEKVEKMKKDFGIGE